MPPPAEPFSLPVEHPDQPEARAFFGQRCASILGTVLLLLFLLSTASRWFTPTASTSLEKIVQQPVAPETSAFSSQNSEATAPDPGDVTP